MVCPRCIDTVDQIFQHLELKITAIQLGQVHIEGAISDDNKQLLKQRLTSKGFELLDNKQSRIVSEIKSIIIQVIHYQESDQLVNFSSLLSEQLRYDYTYLSRLFSSVEGQTIERYIMSQKIEKVKELLTYGEMTISEIAYNMDYSSPAHLSSQFKKITGMSPSAFKKLQKYERKFLDDL